MICSFIDAPGVNCFVDTCIWITEKFYQVVQIFLASTSSTDHVLGLSSPAMMYDGGYYLFQNAFHELDFLMIDMIQVSSGLRLTNRVKIKLRDGPRVGIRV